MAENGRVLADRWRPGHGSSMVPAQAAGGDLLLARLLIWSFGSQRERTPLRIVPGR